MTLYSKHTTVPDRRVGALCPAQRARVGFTLIEVTTALTILALISVSVLVVLNRCMKSAIDSSQRMKAFDVARENMELLLASDSVSETTEYGTSDKYPGIKWQTTVETFYEPITARMWIQGLCSAEYTDSADETQTVTLTHWLTDLTKDQLLQIIRQRMQAQSGEQLFKSLEEAAEYAGVNVETIQQWLEKGMIMTEEGFLTAGMLDLFAEADGAVPAEAINQQTKADEDLIKKAAEPGPKDSIEPASPDQTKPQEKTYKIGNQVFTEEQLQNMSFGEIMALLNQAW